MLDAVSSLLTSKKSLYAKGGSGFFETSSASLVYSAMTTAALVQANPDAFTEIEEDTWDGTSQSNVANLFAALMSGQASGIDVMGYLYASSGMVSLLQSKSTVTFRAWA
ncbi:MAG: hypothetical protein ACOY3I_03885 [Verrucomicrobiota bacterium]